jgi:hypothetical protein
LINVIPIKSTIPDITLLKLKTPIDKNKPFNIKNTGMKRVRTDKIEYFWSQKRQDISDKGDNNKYNI